MQGDHCHHPFIIKFISLLSGMPFHPEEFRSVITENSSKILLAFVKQLIFSIKYDKQPLFLHRAVSELAAILKDPAESPVLKFKSTRLLMYLIIMGELEVYESLKEEIFPLARNACLYNRSQPIAGRGADFFKNNKYTNIANFEEKVKIKNIGCKYIIFCLEFVYVLSQWIPNQPNNDTQKSLFRLSYEALLKQGVQFPNEEQFDYFTAQRIKQIEGQIKQCQSELQKAGEVIEDNYFKSIKSKNDVEMMNGVEYLQRRLKQKDKIISDLKYNISMNDLNRQSIIEKYRDQEFVYIKKIDNYEQRMSDLTEEVKAMKLMIRQNQNDSDEVRKCQQTIKQLHSYIEKLTKQNQQLRENNYKSNSGVSATSLEKFKTPASHALSPREKNYNYLKQLLQIQAQSKQCEIKSKRVLPSLQFFSYKDAKQSFLPYLASLSREQQVRLKKCILKSKDVLYKSKEIQVGVISSLSNDIELDLTIIITNLSEKNIVLQEFKFDYTGDIEIQGAVVGKVGRKKIKPYQQLKQEIKVVVNSIDARCVIMIVEYNQQGSKLENSALILPISRFKLAKSLNYTSHPQDWISIQRVFVFERKVLSNIDKLKDYFPKCFVQSTPQKLYNIKFQLLRTTIFITFSDVDDEKLRIIARFKRQNRCLGQKFLDQFLFILGK